MVTIELGRKTMKTGLATALGVAAYELPYRVCNFIESATGIQDNPTVIRKVGEWGNAVTSYTPEILTGLGIVAGVATAWKYGSRAIENHYNRVEAQRNAQGANPRTGSDNVQDAEVIN